jgi:hypothetical protein
MGCIISYNYLNKIFAVIIFTILYGSCLIAQDVPERKEEKRKEIIEDRKKAKREKSQSASKRKSISSKSDSLKKSTPFATPDTLVKQEINSKVYWYDIENTIRTRKDKIQNFIYRYDKEKQLNYRNMSDIFRQQSHWFNYNLMESGRPAYISSINMYPHQTSFYYNGIMMNDPIHGMFNSQYIPLNFIRNVQVSITGNNFQDFGLGGPSSIHVVSSSKHTQTPWSKILYKQGNYGYSDLDISFVHPATPDLAIQLGGINRIYDGSTLYSDRHGTNYRGEITWQLQNNLFLRGQFFLNRERVGLSTLIQNPSPPQLPKQIDLRDDYFIDLTWLPMDTISQRLHLILYNTYSIRRLKDDNNQHYHNRYQYKRYGFDANYNFNVRGLEFLAGGGSIWNKIWGTGFNKQYFPTYFNTYGKLKIPVSSKLTLNPQAKITFYKEFDPQLSLSFIANNSFNQNNEVSLSISRNIRYPNATEKYLYFDGLYGNSKLLNEDHISVNTNFKSNILSGFGIELTAQYNSINNEIIWENSTFKNIPYRDFFVVAANLNYSTWKLNCQLGGFETISDLYLTSRRSGWFKLHYEDIWLKGALGVDAYGTIQYWGKHTALKYEPRMERFYKLNGIENDYIMLNWKIVATVQDARIFFEMDNSLSEIYEVINQYQEFTQRWRFGVHWILWD